MLQGSLLSSIIAGVSQVVEKDSEDAIAESAIMTPDACLDEDDAVGVNEENEGDAVERPCILASLSLAQCRGMLIFIRSV